MVGLQDSCDFDMGHKGPVLRPRCIGAVRSRTHMQSINQSINQSIRIVKGPMWMTSGDYILPSARTAIAGDGAPTSYWEAINSAQEWVTAMKEEMDALVENDVGVCSSS